ncbi:MAG TPA: hemolysin family protein [Anaerolineales bacterium]|nr:hemolysin family protein [Anaerolineales bacterium]HLO32135.1 hemolysin family protein [Anaerolineales bacterium]
MNSLTTEILILILLILTNGLFALSEMAVVSARKVRLQQRANEGSKGARTALSLAVQPTRFLSTVQIGITLIGILSGAFGGATIAETLAAYFAQYPALQPYSEAIGVGIVVTVVTYFSLVIGELVPKRLALNNAEGIATSVAPIMEFIAKVTKPLVSLLSFSTEILVRLLGIKSTSEPAITEEEVKILIEQGRQSGVFEDVEQEMVERVFRLSDRTVNSLMAHRSEMVWLDVDDPLEVNINKIIASGHFNFVVCEGDFDQVLGILRVKDLLGAYAGGHSVSIKTSLQMPPFVPEGMNALEVLERLRQVKSPLALVVDEYGTIAGMVTLTDVLEAIVGDIPGIDEEGEAEATQREDGSWLLDGMMSVDELQMLLDLDELPEEDLNYDTVGGLFMAQLGRIPMVGDNFEWHNLRFEVMDMDGHRVDKVLVMPMPLTR